MTDGDAFSVFRTQANKELVDIIAGYSDKKIFSCPPYLTMYVATLFDEKNLGGTLVPLASLPKCKPNGDIFIITPSDMECVESICEVLETLPNRKTLLVIPRVTEFVRQAADNHHFQVISSLAELSEPLHQVIVKEFGADFFFTDVDYFLLPCTHTFYHTAIQKDFSDLYAAARSLAKIQTVFGRIPHVVTVGESAAMAKDLMDGIMDQTGCSSTGVPQISSLIIIDRAVDLVTPLMMPTSIEGRLDEYFGINYGVFHVDISADDLRIQADLALDERHPVFKQVRCMGDDAYRELAARWSREAAERDKKVQRVKEREASFEEWLDLMKEVGQLGTMDQVRACVLMIMEKEADLFQRAMLARPQWDLILNGTSVLPLATSYVTMLDDWDTALKLIYLETFAKGPKDVPMEGIIKALAAEFDLNAMETIATMEKVRQLPPVANCAHATAKWNLDCFEESEMGAVCDKFIPVSVQIVRKITSGSSVAIKGIDVSSVGEDTVKDTSSDNRRVLVFFVGGITLSEAGYIRALSSVVFENRVSYIIGATNQLTSRTFIEELRPGLSDTLSLSETV